MNAYSNFDLSSLDDRALLSLGAEVQREISTRGLAATVGEIGESLIIALYKSRPDLSVLVPAPRGTKNIDAISRDGERYSIKTLLRAKKTGTIYPDQADPGKQLFEHLVIVLLSDKFELQRVVSLNWKQFCSVRSWDKRMNAWYVAKSKRALASGTEIYPYPRLP